jgi:hypothetical protein
MENQDCEYIANKMKYEESFKRANQDPEIVNLAEEGLDDYLEMLLEHESK